MVGSLLGSGRSRGRTTFPRAAAPPSRRPPALVTQDESRGWCRQAGIGAAARGSGAAFRGSGSPPPSPLHLRSLSSHPRAQEGLFGFKPFPELWVGRLAMLGFAAGAGDEMVTGVPTLRQLGLITPNPDLFLTLSLLIGGVTLFATGAPARPLVVTHFARM